MLRWIARKIRNTNFVIPGALERILLRKTPLTPDKIELPLIAIVGPPRVGSTLMFQMLVNRYECFCHDNFQHAFLRYPYLGFLFSHYFLNQPRAGYTSDHGFVKGLRGISEGNFFWPYWFDLQMDQSVPAPNSSKLRYAYRTLNRIFEITGHPMVTSYNAHSFYLADLQRHFRNIVIVQMHRNPIDNAVSILRARKLIRSNVTQWWSVRPSVCRSVDSQDPYEQIVCQIVETYREIRRQRSLITIPCLDVDYEHLCSDPSEVLGRVMRVCRESSIGLRERSEGQAVPPIDQKRVRHDESADAENFRKVFSRMHCEDLFTQMEIVQ